MTRQERLPAAIIAALREACRALGATLPPGLDTNHVDPSELRRREIKMLAQAHRVCAEELSPEYALSMLADSMDEAVLWMHTTLAASLGVQANEMRSTATLYRVLRAALTLLHCGLAKAADPIGDIEARVLGAAATVFYRREYQR